MVLKQNIKIILTKRNHNAIKKNYLMTGKKNGAHTMDLDIVAMKVYCKKRGCTINDYTTALISNTLYEYMEINKIVDGIEYAIPNEISTVIPISLRQPFKKIEDVKMCNDFVAMPVQIVIRKELEESLPLIKSLFDSMRGSLDVYGMLQVFNMSVSYPFTLPRVMIDFLANKYTICYSNLNASKIPYIWDGKKQLGQFYFPPAIGNFCCGISLCTTGPFMSLSCFSDENSIKDP